MHITINNETHPIEEKEVEAIIRQIERLVGKEQYVQSFTIDGRALDESLETYLAAHRETIRDIQITTIAGDVFIPQIVEAGEEYIVRLVQNLPKTIDQFKEGPTSEAWADLNDLFAGLQWLLAMSDVVEHAANRPASWDDVEAVGTQLNSNLPAIERAVETNQLDELISLLETLVRDLTTYNEQLTHILDTELQRTNTQ